MPSGAIDKHCGVSIFGYLCADFLQMPRHHFRAHGGQDQADRHIACRAECAEDIGVFVARIDGRAEPYAACAPTARTSTLLTYAAFVLAPDLDDFVRACRLDCGDDLGEFFLNASMASASCFGWVGRAVT